jgi:hypothetical protein
MINNALIIVLVLAAIGVILQLVLIFRKVSVNAGAVDEALQIIERNYERMERAVRKRFPGIGKNRPMPSGSPGRNWPAP